MGKLILQSLCRLRQMELFLDIVERWGLLLVDVFMVEKYVVRDVVAHVGVPPNRRVWFRQSEAISFIHVLLQEILLISFICHNSLALTLNFAMSKALYEQ